jgi:ubiquinone/menaquinone biosynthesis C-methylase UbiE
MKRAISNTIGWLQEKFPALCNLTNTTPAGMKPFYDLVEKELALGAGQRVLDFGCGQGTFAKLFQSKDYVGIDVSEPLIRFASKRYPDYRFFAVNGAKLNFESASFDGAFAMGVFHHIDDATSKQALKQITRVLKPGARFVVIEPVPAVSRWNIAGRIMKSLDLGEYIRPYEAWSALFSSAFQTEKIYPYRIGFNDLCIFVGKR